MVVDTEAGNYITEGGIVKGKKEGTKDRALGYSIGKWKGIWKAITLLTFCLWFER